MIQLWMRRVVAICLAFCGCSLCSGQDQEAAPAERNAAAAQQAADSGEQPSDEEPEQPIAEAIAEATAYVMAELLAGVIDLVNVDWSDEPEDEEGPEVAQLRALIVGPQADSNASGIVLTKAEKAPAPPPPFGKRAPEAAIPIMVTPYYDSNGPQIEVGAFSELLTEATADSILDIAARIKQRWRTNSVELMYVLSIRLFELGHKDEAVYWWYSAVYRARVYHYISIVPQPAKLGGQNFERLHAHDAFFSLAGSFMKTHAFQNSMATQATIRKVLNEHKTLPDFSVMYPDDTFTADDQWEQQNQRATKDMEDFLAFIVKDADLLRKAYSGDEKAKALLSAGSPLRAAMKLKDREEYQRLLVNGANPNETSDGGFAAVHDAANEDDVFWLREALRHGGDPNLPYTLRRTGRTGTPLFVAVVSDHTENAVELIKAGAEVNYVSSDFKTPLYLAMECGNWAVAQKLFEAGADPIPPEPARPIPFFRFDFTYGSVVSGDDERPYQELRIRLIESGYPEAAGK